VTDNGATSMYPPCIGFVIAGMFPGETYTAIHTPHVPARSYWSAVDL